MPIISRRRGANAPIDLILSRLPDAKNSGKGWSCRCPAHEDRRASLSIAEGDDGRALLRCFAGCRTEDVVAAIGLRMIDLMPTANQLPPPRRNGKTSHKTERVFPSAEAAIAALEKKHGPITACWEYHDALGERAGVILRWDREGGKDIRPIAKYSDGWRIAGMFEPRPLFNLSAVIKAQTVVVSEGEKSAAALNGIGVVATTSPHGAQSASKADWAPLAGKRVVLWPDSDRAGERYIEDVQAILTKLSPPPIVKIIRPPGLPDGGDAADWVESFGDAAEPATLRVELERLIEGAMPIKVEAPKRPRIEVDPKYVPFPTHHLPGPMRAIVEAGASAIGCDRAFLALAALCACGGLIGGSRRLLAKRNWLVPPILWGCILAESGTQKSPAMRLILAPLRERARRESIAYEAAKQAAKEAGSDPPAMRRTIVSNITTEALALIARDNPNGLLLAMDELAGVLAGFDRYAAKGGADEAFFLSSFDGESFIADRKRDREHVFVPSVCLSIVGTCQPSTFSRLMSQQRKDSGLLARFIFVKPPIQAKRWNEAEVDEGIEKRWADLLNQLANLDLGADGKPIVVPLGRDAKSAFRTFYDLHNQSAAEETGCWRSLLAKMEQLPLRLALVLHHVRWAGGEAIDVTEVAADTMENAIALTRWFIDEARRVYDRLDASDEDDELETLAAWIRERGGSTTVRELTRTGPAAMRGRAMMLLRRLVDGGYGDWADLPPGPEGGRPSRAFVLAPPDSIS